MIDITKFKDRLRTAMNESGLQRKQIADLVGVSIATIYKWQRSNGTKSITNDQVSALCKVLDVSPAFLLGDDVPYETLEHSKRREELMSKLMHLDSGQLEAVIAVVDHCIEVNRKKKDKH